ncbi:MAG: carboxypeptidase regulatory-like domain-containing protein, partial [Acidobacteriota bacterium]
TPQQPLAGASTYTITVLNGITDLIGNPLQAGASASFATLDDLAPAPPTIEPELPAITAETSLIVAGTAESNANVEITGGAVKVNTLASDTGHYSAQVALFEDAVNQLSVTATDLSGNVSTPATTTIVQDSIRMVVVDASFELDGSIIIDFSKPVNLSSVTSQNIYVLATSTITGNVIAASDPTRIIFYPQIALNNPPIPFVLKVEPSVEDQGGHPLEYPFHKLFNGASGNSFVQGEVWDNATGQPLAGATVTQIAPAITPAPIATTDLKGQFTLPVSSGTVTLRVERAGYLHSYRFVNAPAGQAVVMFDARLEPVSSTVLNLTTSQNTLANADGSISLITPAGAVSQETTVVLSKRDGQSLPGLLPDGWAPVAVGTFATSAALQQEVTLRVKNESGMGAFSSTPTAYYDEASSVWRTGPAGFVSSDGQYFEVQTNKATTHAFLMFDPTDPPAPSLPDQPLLPSNGAAVPPSGIPNLVAIPIGIYPQQRAVVSTTFSGAQFKSGSRFQAILKEKFNLLAGVGSVETTPKTADLIGYS